MPKIEIDTDKLKDIKPEQAKQNGVFLVQVGEFMIKNSFPMPVKEVLNLNQITTLFNSEIGFPPAQWSDDTYLVHNWSDWLEFFKYYKWVDGPNYPWTINANMAYQDCDKFAFHIAALACWTFRTNTFFKASGVITWPEGGQTKTGNHAYNLIVAKDETGKNCVYLYDPMYNYSQKFTERKANRGNVTYNSTYSIITI